MLSCALQPRFEDDLDVPFGKREIKNGDTFAHVCDFLLPGAPARHRRAVNSQQAVLSQ